MKKLKAVIAGSTGFLGSALMRGLDTRYQLIPLRRNHDTGRGDLAVPHAMLPELPQADVLFHVAGLTLGRVDPEEMALVYSTNIQITLNLITACHKAGIPKIVFASSYVYGHPTYTPIDEKHPVEGITPYMHSKIVCEEILQAYTRWANLDVVSLRLFNIYGPGQQPGLLIPDLLAQINHPALVLGDARPRRDFVYIDDVVAAFDQAAQSKLKGWDVINIGFGESFSVEQVAQSLLQAAGSSAELRFERPSRPVEIKDVVADISKARKVLNWNPQIDLEEGLRRVVAGRALLRKEIHAHR